MQKYDVFFCVIFTKNTIVFTNCRKVFFAVKRLYVFAPWQSISNIPTISWRRVPELGPVVLFMQNRQHPYRMLPVSV
jgi:hypothetical protein